MARWRWRCRGGRGGFTLIELLVVIAILVVLMALLLPALSQAKQKGLSVACMNNLRQLHICFREYTDENGQFPSNNLVHAIGEGTLLGPTWAPGDLNTDTTIDLAEYGSLFPYNENLGIYKCPADKSLLPGSSDGQRRVPSLHSYNLNIWFNCILEPFGYVTEGEMDSVSKPTSEIFLFIDTHAASIVDPAFGIYHSTSGLARNNWVDLPADRHSRGGNLIFLDGHVEHHRWKAPKVFVENGQRADAGPDRDDLRWLQGCLPPKLSRSFVDQMAQR